MLGFLDQCRLRITVTLRPSSTISMYTGIGFLKAFWLKTIWQVCTRNKCIRKNECLTVDTPAMLKEKSGKPDAPTLCQFQSSACRSDILNTETKSQPGSNSSGRGGRGARPLSMETASGIKMGSPWVRRLPSYQVTTPRDGTTPKDDIIPKDSG